MAPLTELLVIAHTHWDREWYHSLSGFRARLTGLVDELLDHPGPPGNSFLLDGQAILLEDYVAVRPERAAELSALVRDGRLEAGPWYVLADELIPSGEALVRNLLAGRDTLRRFRGAAPSVLYCPDSFGHPAALPIIAHGFGCDVIVLWRGFGGGRWHGHDCARWRGPDGSAVLLYHLPPDGYEFGSSLPTDPAQARSRWARIHSVMGARSATGVSLLLNGADHHARQRDLAEAVAALATVAAPVRVGGASLGAAAARLLDAAARVQLPEVSGELRDSYGYTWTLGGTLGTRAHQKRANAMAERLLVRDVEPWVALLPGGGAATSRALLQSAWRTLLAAHPHDTLCGTSIDEVAMAFDARVRASSEEGEVIRDGAVNDLVGHDAESARLVPDAWRSVAVIRNPAPRARGGIVEMTLTAKVADIAVGPGSAARQGARTRPSAFRVDGVRMQVLERAERVELTESPRAYPDADAVVEVRAVGWMEPMKGYGVVTRMHRGHAMPDLPTPVAVTPSTLDNGRVRIDVSVTGEVSFHGRELGVTIASLLRFERHEDAGDLYTPSIRAPLDAPRHVRTRVLHRGPIRGALRLDYRLGARSAGSCALTITLDADARHARIDVQGDNREADHRLRLVVATGCTGGRTLADAAFGPVERSNMLVSDGDFKCGAVVRTAPLQRWVARFSDIAGAVLVSDGLAEYESLDNGDIAATLVRSVGELSRHDLPERPGHAGWPAPTPLAQCPGPYAARFAFRALGPDADGVRAEIERFADDVLLPITARTLRSNVGEATEVGGLELVGDGLAFSAALPSARCGVDNAALRESARCARRSERGTCTAT